MRKRETAPQMTKLEILHELFESDKGYIKNPTTRGMTTNGHCIYRTDEGKRCAVGKCVSNHYIGKVAKLAASAGNITKKLREVHGISVPDLDTVLLKKYRGHEPHFWSLIQSFHDSSANWGDYHSPKLTSNGSKRLKDLKERLSE